MEINCQPEVAEEMHHCLGTDELWVVGHKMGKNRAHMVGSLEDNGVYELQSVAGRQAEVAGLQSSASPQQFG